MMAYLLLVAWLGTCAGFTPTTRPPSEIAASYGYNANITCSYPGFVSTDPYLWMHNNTVIHQQGNEDKYDIIKAQNEITLVIKSININDSGYYLCNVDFKNSLPVKLYVFSLPEIGRISVSLVDRKIVIRAGDVFPPDPYIVQIKVSTGTYKLSSFTKPVFTKAEDRNLFDLVLTSLVLKEEILEVTVVFSIYGYSVTKTQLLTGPGPVSAASAHLFYLLLLLLILPVVIGIWALIRKFRPYFEEEYLLKTVAWFRRSKDSKRRMTPALRQITY